MSALGIVYSVDSIRAALGLKPLAVDDAAAVDEDEGEECIGLIFTKPHPLFNDENVNKVIDSLYNIRKFEVYAICHNSTSESLSRKLVTLDIISHSIYNIAKNIIEPNNATDDLPSREDVIVSNYQFLDGKIDFVFFGKPQLEAIMRSVVSVTISGAEINHGIGTTTLGGELSSGNVSYPTLKAESRVRINDEKYVPNVIVGLPCPPVWGGSNLAFLSGLNLSDIQFIKFQSVWNNFANDFITELGNRCPPPVRISFSKKS